MRQHLVNKDPAALDVVVEATGESADGTAFLRVSGALDAATSPRLQAELFAHLDAPPHRVRIDLSAVRFMDSSGLRVLLGATLRAGTHRETFQLVNPSPAVVRVLEMSRIGDLLTITA